MFWTAGEARGQAAAAAGSPRAATTPVSIALGVAASDSAAPGQWDDDTFHTPVVRVGQDYTLRSGETARVVRSVLGDVTLEGQVERDAVVILGSVQVKASAVVDGALVVIGGSATIEPGARVGRELVVIGGSLEAPAGFAPGGDFIAIGTPAMGQALQAFVPWLTRGLLWGRPIVPDLGWVWAVLGILLLAYLVINFLFDGPVGASADAVLERPLSVFFLGLLVLILTVPALAILAATVIGLAVVPFVVCALVVAGLIGKAGVARALGRSLTGERLQGSMVASLVAFALGAAVLVVAYMVPVLGLVTWAFTSVLGVGAAAVMIRRRMRSEGRGRQRAAARPTGIEPTVGADAPEAASAPSFARARFEEPPPAPSSASALFEEAPPPAVAPPPIGTPPPLEPSPGTGRAGLFPTATFLDRVAAFALDCLLVALAVELLDLSRYEGAFPLLLVAYHIAFWTWKGTTLGGVVVGLRVTRVNGQGLRFADALVRGLSGVFSIGAFGIGCFWMLQDPARQMWHDKIAGTQVVKMPRELVLQDG
jgi:uncharacterized RDD family membrane protein YckC